MQRRAVLQSAAGLAALMALPRARADEADRAMAPTPVPGLDWFVFLERGTPTPPDKERVMAMQKGHIANFERLFAAGQLFAAGPLRDPTQVKRGIVIVRAPDAETLRHYFDDDAYVAQGHMTLNAQPCITRQALQTSGLDRSKIVENRIVLLTRTGSAAPAPPRQLTDRLETLLEMGVFGAWYEMQAGPIHHILFRRGIDDAPLHEALASLPGRTVGGLQADVWSQWFAQGVVR